MKQKLKKSTYIAATNSLSFQWSLLIPSENIFSAVRGDQECVFSPNAGNTDQKNSEYEHLSRSANVSFRETYFFCIYSVGIDSDIAEYVLLLNFQ